MKRCLKCKTQKSLKQFYQAKAGKIIRAICKTCDYKRYKTYHPTGRPDALRKCLYRITKQKYQELLKQQNGLCAICHKNNILNRSLAVDHCHKTGKIRGLLCFHCNLAIGMLKDEPMLLARAITYLKEN